MATFTPATLRFAPRPPKRPNGGTDIFIILGVVAFAHYVLNRPNKKQQPELEVYKGTSLYLTINEHNALVHDIKHHNIDCLKHRGYTIRQPTRHFNRYRELVATIDDYRTLETFRKDCKECDVYSELQYDPSHYDSHEYATTIKRSWHNALVLK
jgi:hypothetical protein